MKIIKQGKTKCILQGGLVMKQICLLLLLLIGIAPYMQLHAAPAAKNEQASGWSFGSALRGAWNWTTARPVLSTGIGIAGGLVVAKFMLGAILGLSFWPFLAVLGGIIAVAWLIDRYWGSTPSTQQTLLPVITREVKKADESAREVLHGARQINRAVDISVAQQLSEAEIKNATEKTVHQNSNKLKRLRELESLNKADQEQKQVMAQAATQRASQQNQNPMPTRKTVRIWV